MNVSERFAGNVLYEPLRELGYDGLSDWAWTHYLDVVTTFARAGVARTGRNVRLLEVGGGRNPLLTPQQARAIGIDVTVNDISRDELARAPTEFKGLCLDISGRLDATAEQIGQYDLIISRMVFEHLAHATTAWANVHELLAPGGVNLAFLPTLYAPPFLMNWLMPERISALVLRAFYGERNDAEIPKFPARYDSCFGDQRKLEPMLREIGFRDVLVLPFWTHGYFARVPLLARGERKLQLLARQRDWRSLTSYAYVIARR